LTIVKATEDASSSDQHQYQAELQAQHRGAGFLEAIGQAVRHRQHRAGTGRNGDQGTGDDEGDPGGEAHGGG
jgi:hypothetical protein